MSSPLRGPLAGDVPGDGRAAAAADDDDDHEEEEEEEEEEAVQQATMFHYRLAAGRWYTPAEEQTRAHVAVVERDIAQATGTRLGDSISVQTASGPASFRVIGISTNQQGRIG